MVGLKESEVKNRRALYGVNVLTPAKRDPWYVMLLDGFKDPLIIILSVAAVLSLVIGVIKTEFMEPIGIIAAIALAVGIGFWNTYSASKKFDLLLTYADDTKVKCYRDGQLIEVARKDLVKDDVVILESGEEVPADLEILSGECRCDESSFTGESRPILKGDTVAAEDNEPYPAKTLLKGSIIVEGRVECKVTNVGDHTVLGGMARQASEITDVETPLNKQLNRLADMINKIAFISAGILITALIVKYALIDQAYLEKDGFEMANDLLQFLMIAVALIVVAVPEGLPMAVTLALAYSMKKMASENNLIKKMHACETLGATTLILTDKTGTLTENKMTVVFKSEDVSYDDIVLNSTALNKIGNPTEQALIRSLNSTDEAITTWRESNTIAYREEFNSERKYMKTVIAREDGEFVSMVKGAPEIVLGFCIDKSDDMYKKHQSKGRRVIGFAVKTVGTPDEFADNHGFTWLGCAAIEDPVRSDVPAAIKQAREAGIKVKIVTGDNAETAVEIAKQAKISDYPIRLLGNALENTNIGMLRATDVFARTRPEDKQILVKRFQADGEVVAMTGDGRFCPVLW